METDEHLCKFYRDVFENVKTAFPTITKQVKAKQQTKQQNQCVITCIECLHTVACSRTCSRSCPSLLSIWLFVFVFVVYSFCCCIHLLCLYYPKGFGNKASHLSTQKHSTPVPVLQCCSFSRLQCQSLGLSHTTIQFILKCLCLNPSWKKWVFCEFFLLKNWQ